MSMVTELILSSYLSDNCRVIAHLDCTIKQQLCLYYLLVKYKPLKNCQPPIFQSSEEKEDPLFRSPCKWKHVEIK